MRKIKYASPLKGTPFLGRLPHLLKPNGLLNNLIDAGKIAEKDPFGRCYFYLGYKLYLLVTRPEDVRQVELLNAQHISRYKAFNTNPNSGVEELAGNFIGLRKDESWKLKKYAVRTCIANQNSLSHLLEPTIELIQKCLHAHLNSSEKLTLNHLTSTFVLNLIGSVVLRLQNIWEIQTPLEEHIYEFEVEALDAMNQIRWVLPKLLRKIFFKNKETDIHRLRRYFEDNVDKLILEPNRDFLTSQQSLLNTLYHIEQKLRGKPLSLREGLYADANSLFIAVGNLTASLNFIIRLLNQHSHVKTKLLHHIYNHLGQNPTSIDINTINNIPYLEMVIKECLRLYPPIIMNPKGVDSAFYLLDVDSTISSQDYEQLKMQATSENSLYLKENDVIVTSAYLTQRMSTYFENPLEFLPERFENTQISYSNFFPFGMGMQACVGKNLAMQTLKLFIAILYSSYDVFIEEEDDLSLMVFAGGIRFKKDVNLKLKPH